MTLFSILDLLPRMSTAARSPPRQGVDAQDHMCGGDERLVGDLVDFSYSVYEWHCIFYMNTPPGQFCPACWRPSSGEDPFLRRLDMKNASFLVTEGIPGVAAKGEIIKVSDGGILIGRWLPISKYPKLMESRDSLRTPSVGQHSPPSRPPRRSRGWRRGD